MRLGYANLIAYALTVTYELENNEPKTYVESIGNQHSFWWLKAIQDDMECL